MQAFFDQFLAVFNILLPVFAVAGIGFAWAKSGRPYPTRELTAFITLVGTPCLLFSSLLTREAPFLGLVVYMVACVGIIGFLTVLSYFILPIFGGDRRALTAAFSFPNVGNIGLPVCILAFGAAGEAYALVYFAVSATLMHTMGRWAHRGETGFFMILQSPVPWTVAVTLALIWWRDQTGIILAPAWVLDATRLIGGMVIPAVLISLGVAISHMKLAHLSHNLALSLTRFGLGLVAALIGVQILGFEGVPAKVFILQTIMPIAVLNYMFAAMYDNYVKETAALVMTSNLLAIFTLPIVLWFMV